MTTAQMQAGAKDVTRRNGWLFLEGGEVLQPVKRSQGLKKGESVVKITRPIVVINAHRERLDRMTEDLEYGRREVIREGFPNLTPAAFVAMYCAHNGCRPSDLVTRIEFSFQGVSA